MKRSSMRSSLPVLFGLSWIVAVIAYLAIHGPPQVFSRTHEERGGSSHLFTKIFRSFIDNDALPFRPHLYLSREPGVHVSRSVRRGDILVSIPIESSGLVIDGSIMSTIPPKISYLLGFETLSATAKTILSISYYKRMDNRDIIGSVSSALALLWKAIGVHPFPDKRWVKYKALFSVDPAGSSGIDEMDGFIRDAQTVLSESFSFVKTHSLSKSYGISESDLRWSYIFLHAFGVRQPDNQYILIAPLMFARKSVHASSIEFERSSDGLGFNVIATRDLARGDEVVIDASAYFTDSFAFAFQGSWVAHDSIHRVWVNLPPVRYWISNDPIEQANFRNTLVESFEAKHPHSPLWITYMDIVDALRGKLAQIVTTPPSESQVDKLRLMYVQFLIGEIIHFEKGAVTQKRDSVDV
jgi:hypothetical protein